MTSDSGSSKLTPPGGIRGIVETEAHHKLGISLGVAVIVLAITLCWLSLPVSIIISWDAFALCSLVLAWLGMFYTDAQSRAREAKLQDSSYTALCLCMMLAAIAGLAAAGVLLSSAKSLSKVEATEHVVLAGLTILSSWVLVHTMMAQHYAHVFYSQHRKGLSFPEEENPDFLDFAYFSFVIGMTFQVSDVQITSRRLRRIVLLHGLLSFAYNTIILAFSINLAATLV
ncbi:MAG: DUF1345 domain-containing protein [Candidatus Methylacidiphilales bacterium]|nr:DUF1345 domain-containing protein [Candidatus Methylacidiphilales bacterium]